MLGANKTVTIQRLNDDKTAYEDKFCNINVRWSPVKGKKSTDVYDIKAKHITYKMMMDSMDIRSGDRVFFCNPVTKVSEKYVIAGGRPNDDSMGKHTSVIMRQVASYIHDTITWWKPNDSQPQYDPLLEEYFDSGQNFDNTVITVLMDPIDSAKATFIKFIDAGKLEDIDYIMTVDFPDVVTNKHKFTYQDVIYEVKWILPLPFQTLVGLKKTILNYVKPA